MCRGLFCDKLGLSPLAPERLRTHIVWKDAKSDRLRSSDAAGLPSGAISQGAFSRLVAMETLTMSVKLRIRPWRKRLRSQFFIYRRMGWGRFKSLRAAWQVTWSGGNL
jgi:hypothetical protein